MTDLRALSDRRARRAATLCLLALCGWGCDRDGDAHSGGSSALSSIAQPAVLSAPSVATALAPSATSTKAAPPSAADAAPSAKAGASTPPRDIHPVGGGASCIEMYSQCSAGSCSSAPLVLECGERGTVPSSGESLRCVCP